MKPTITLRPSSPVVINEGSATTLRCDAIRSPHQTLVWIKNSTILSRTIFTTGSVSYTITSATKDHAGVYTCKVITPPGLPAQYNTSYNVTVKVRCKLPMFLGRKLWQVHFVRLNRFKLGFYRGACVFLRIKYSPF